MHSVALPFFYRGSPVVEAVAQTSLIYKMKLLGDELYPDPAIYIYPLAKERVDSFPLLSSCRAIIFPV